MDVNFIETIGLKDDFITLGDFLYYLMSTKEERKNY